MSETERVPAVLQGKYDEIAVLTDQFCQQHLNEEYRDLCRLWLPNFAASVRRRSPPAKPTRGLVALFTRWAGSTFFLTRTRRRTCGRMNYANTLASVQKQARRNRRRLWSR